MAIYRCLFVFIILFSTPNCSFDESVCEVSTKNYPYLKPGLEIYPDIHLYQVTGETSVCDIFEYSYFAQLPDFESAYSNGHFEVKNDILVIHGDGGFGGGIFSKSDGDNCSLKIDFPRLESVISLDLKRVDHGWLVVGYANE